MAMRQKDDATHSFLSVDVQDLFENTCEFPSHLGTTSVSVPRDRVGRSALVISLQFSTEIYM